MITVTKLINTTDVVISYGSILFKLEYANKFSGHEIYLLLIDDSKFYMKQKMPGVLFLPHIMFIVGLDLFQTSVIDT